MACYIIDNSKSTHLSEVKRLFSGCSEILIASPFITMEAVEQLNNCIPEVLGSLTLVTTMKAKDDDQLRKIPVLLKLYSLLSKRVSNLLVRVDDKLHGKVYIGRDNNQFKGAIISSANLTGNGLIYNHEWGVFVDDSAEIQRVYDQIMKDTVRDIDRVVLVSMKKWMEVHKLNVERKPKYNLNLLEMLSPVAVNKNEVTCWLKPYGTVKNPVLTTTKFDADPFCVTFAKGVNNVKEGDVLIVYAVGSRMVLSVFVATGQRGKLTEFENPRDGRWPYYVICDNLTPLFGANWPSFNLTLDFLKKSYLYKYPYKNVRPGSQNFSALQWGGDRLKLDREFAFFVIGEVLKEIGAGDKQI